MPQFEANAARRAGNGVCSEYALKRVFYLVVVGHDAAARSSRSILPHRFSLGWVLSRAAEATRRQQSILAQDWPELDL